MCFYENSSMRVAWIQWSAWKLQKTVFLERCIMRDGFWNDCIRDHEMQVDAEKIKMASEKLKHALELIQVCESKEQLRGFEGEAASVYFGVFDEMILQQKK